MRAFQRRRVADTWDARAYQSPKIDDIAGSNNTSHRCGVDRRASRHRHGTALTADEQRSNSDEHTQRSGGAQERRDNDRRALSRFDASTHCMIIRRGHGNAVEARRIIKSMRH